MQNRVPSVACTGGSVPQAEEIKNDWGVKAADVSQGNLLINRNSFVLTIYIERERIQICICIYIMCLINLYILCVHYL